MKYDNLIDVIKKIKTCKNCSLCDTRKHAVPGTGNPNADIFIIGECPGQNEDELGLPLVGRCGKLVTNMLESKYLGLHREEVFISNVLHCRPPNNRNPKEEEIDVCSNYLKAQIEIVKPKVLFTLGRFATAWALDRKEVKITKIRGYLREYTFDENIMVLPTFHPSYLLRDTKQKKYVKEDLKTLANTLYNINIIKNKEV